MSEVIGIGAAPRRKEDLRFLTGRGNYVADINRPEMVVGVFVRSRHAHARIKSIDPSAALAMPGVLAVFTGSDLKADEVNGLPCGWGILWKRVRGLPNFIPNPANIRWGRRASFRTWWGCSWVFSCSTSRSTSCGLSLPTSAVDSA